MEQPQDVAIKDSSGDIVEVMEGPKASDGQQSPTQHNNDSSQEDKQQQQLLIDTPPPTKDYHSMLKNLKQNGHKVRSDLDQPSLLEKPKWFDELLFDNAKSVYNRHFMGVNFAHLSGLLLLVRVNSIYRTLSLTGKSDSVAKLFNRYYQTLIHVKKWYEGDIFEENSDAYRSLLIVRGMHNKVSATLNSDKTPSGCETGIESNELKTNEQTDGGDDHHRGQQQTVDQDKENSAGESSKLIDASSQSTTVAAVVDVVPKETSGYVHISEYDIMITQFAFIGFIVTKANNVGFLDDFNQRDLDSLLHFWRVIGFYLGASDNYNLCSYKSDDIAGLCQAIIDIEYKHSIAANPIGSPPGIMSVNIIRSAKYIPLLTIYGILRYLYELLGIETSELSSKESRYSRLSYTLIKLVMSRLLAYKVLRSFNNGLTRLSVYIVGRIDNWFFNRLESKYGQEMKL